MIKAPCYLKIMSLYAVGNKKMKIYESEKKFFLICKIVQNNSYLCINSNENNVKKLLAFLQPMFCCVNRMKMSEPYKKTFFEKFLTILLFLFHIVEKICRSSFTSASTQVLSKKLNGRRMRMKWTLKIYKR